MDAPLLAVGAVLAALVVAGLVSLCRGNVGLISSFPQDPDTLSRKDRASMGRGVAGVIAFVAALMVVLGWFVSTRGA